MFSLKIRYALYGVILSASLITIVAQASTTDGVFGEYFRNMVGVCLSSEEVVVGFDTNPTVTIFGQKTCKTLTSLLNIIGINVVGTKVGLGEIAPSAKLEIAAPVDNMIRLNKQGITNWNYIEWSYQGTRQYWTGLDINGIFNIQSDLNNPVLINANGGDVGIGTSAPTARLHVNGNIKLGNSGVACNASSEGQIRYNLTTKTLEFCDGIVWKASSVPACIPNGSCSASAPACGSTTYGVDNCGTACSKTGPACACVPIAGSCSAAAPACETTTYGVDSCGTACSKTGGACITIGTWQPGATNQVGPGMCNNDTGAAQSQLLTGYSSSYNDCPGLTIQGMTCIGVGSSCNKASVTWNFVSPINDPHGCIDQGGAYWSEIRYNTWNCQ